jgi:hypothetical protein
MTYLTGEVTVIHNNTQVDFDKFVYSGVYCNVASGGGGFTINGASVIMAAGDTLEVLVDGETTDIFPAIGDFLLLGNPEPVQTEFKTGLLSGSPHNEVWQFVNIKNGNPTG